MKINKYIYIGKPRLLTFILIFKEKHFTLNNKTSLNQNLVNSAALSIINI